MGTKFEEHQSQRVSRRGDAQKIWSEKEVGGWMNEMATDIGRKGEKVDGWQ